MKTMKLIIIFTIIATLMITIATGEGAMSVSVINIKFLFINFIILINVDILI